MNKKRILLIVLGVVVVGALVIIFVFGGAGKFFQGALYNIRPIYRECRIEGQNYNSNQSIDCEDFYKKFQSHTFPDGEYTISAKYVDQRLTDNLIPINIAGLDMQCTYLENGYTPNFTVYNPNNPGAAENIKDRQEVPVGTEGLVVQMNYQKDGQNYFYDTNICEYAFRGLVSDGDKKPLGEARLDYNDFIKSQSLVNAVQILDKPYYTDNSGNTVKDFNAGNFYLALSAAPDILFKFTLPCSAQKVSVEIPTLQTDKDMVIPFKGLTEQYLNNCGSRLYLGLQNTNRADDIQTISDLNLEYLDGIAMYHLKLNQIGRVNDVNVIYPISFKVNLYERDRSDSQDVQNLGSGVLTITANNNPPPSTADQTAAATTGAAPISDLQASTEVGAAVIQDLTASSDIGAAASANRPKVKRAS